MTASPKIGPFPQATNLQPQAKALSAVAQTRCLRSGAPASRSDSSRLPAAQSRTGLGKFGGNRRGVLTTSIWTANHEQPAIASGKGAQTRGCHMWDRGRKRLFSLTFSAAGLRDLLHFNVPSIHPPRPLKRPSGISSICHVQVLISCYSMLLRGSLC